LIELEGNFNEIIVTYSCIKKSGMYRFQFRSNISNVKIANKIILKKIR